MLRNSAEFFWVEFCMLRAYPEGGRTSKVFEILERRVRTQEGNSAISDQTQSTCLLEYSIHEFD